jgi:hypothetical protein
LIWGVPACEAVDEWVQAFLERPIENNWPHFWLDTTYVIGRDQRLIALGGRLRKSGISARKSMLSGSSSLISLNQAS